MSKHLPGSVIELDEIKPSEIETIKEENGEIASPSNKGSTLNVRQMNIHKPFSICHFSFFVCLLFLQTVMTYVFKPICTILQIVLLSEITKIKASELVEVSAGTITKPLQAIGYCIIFLLPMINFFIKGIIIIAIQNSLLTKFYTTLIILVEFIFQIPLTFMLENSLHSIFLFDQRGIEQLLCPWLVFFPSDYLLSVFELLRQYIDSIYFLVIGFRTYSSIDQNKYQAFIVSILMVMIVLCLFKIIGNTAMLILRIFWGTSEEKGNKKPKRR